MFIILVDYHLEGQSLLLAGTLLEQSWTTLLDLRFTHLIGEGLSPSSRDRDIWRYCSSTWHGAVHGQSSHDRAGHAGTNHPRGEYPSSLPVLTVAAAKRLSERAYHDRCAERLAKILFDLDDYRSAARNFIP